MNFDDALHELTRTSSYAYALITNEDVMAPAERIDLWIVARDVLDELAIAVRHLQTDATLALADLGVKPGGLHPAMGGIVKRGTRRVGTDQWAGHALVGALGVDLVNPATGEIVRAVPVEVVREVVPGCATEELTSSRWRATGLRGRVDVDRFHVQRPTSEEVIELVYAADKERS
jgi:hypothetical protein